MQLLNEPREAAASHHRRLGGEPRSIDVCAVHGAEDKLTANVRREERKKAFERARQISVLTEDHVQGPGSEEVAGVDGDERAIDVRIESSRGEHGDPHAKRDISLADVGVGRAAHDARFQPRFRERLFDACPSAEARRVRDEGILRERLQRERFLF